MNTLKTDTKLAIDESLREWRASSKRLEEKVRRLELAMNAARKRGETERELQSAQLMSDLRLLQLHYSKKIVAAHHLMVRLQSIADPESEAANKHIDWRPEIL